MTIEPNDSGPPAANIDEVLAEFEVRRESLVAFCAKTKGLIEACLEDTGIRFQSVQARVKSKKKLREKYLNPTKRYCRLDDITDLAALRVVTYYEDEVDRVADVIRREFKIDAKNSVDKRETDPDRFGYYALNFVCFHSDVRVKDVEYKRYAGICCEIQVTSILRHAWSEIQHDWYDLKDAYPHDVRRRFARMAALLEIAESEFLDIRKRKDDFQRSVDLQVEAEVVDLLIDPASMRSFIERDTVLEHLDQKIAALLNMSWVSDIPGDIDMLIKAVNKAGITTVQGLREELSKNEGKVIEYVTRCHHLWYAVAGSPLRRGATLFYLSMMFVMARNTVSEVSAFAGELGFNIMDSSRFGKEKIIVEKILETSSADLRTDH